MGVVGRVCVCIGLGGALVLSFFVIGSPASAQSALLDALSTRVTLEHPGSVADEVAVERVIRSGDTVATDETGRAVVTYPDGSTALLEEKSALDRKSTRLNSSHVSISYAVFCLKKKNLRVMRFRRNNAVFHTP